MTTKPTKSLYKVFPNEAAPFELEASGRQAWMLNQLIEAGEEGFTAKDAPGARVSDYIRRLRLEGVPIETVRQKHGGAFPGIHGVYVLQAEVTKVDQVTEPGQVHA